MILNGLNNLEINFKGINCFLINDHKKHNDIVYYLEQYFDKYKYQINDYDRYNVDEVLILDRLDTISRNRYHQCVFIDNHKDIDKYLKNSKDTILYENNENKFSNINLTKYEEQINNIYCEIVKEYQHMYNDSIFEINEKTFSHELFLKNIIEFEINDYSNVNRIITILSMIMENSKNNGKKSFVCLTNIEKYLDLAEYKTLCNYITEKEMESYLDLFISYYDGKYINFDVKSYIINKDKIINMYNLNEALKLVEDNITQIKFANKDDISRTIKNNIYYITNDKQINEIDLEIINIIKSGKKINIENDIITISECDII